MHAYEFGQKMAATMLPGDLNNSAPAGLAPLAGVSAAKPSPLATYNMYAPPATDPDPLTGVLPQFDASKGGLPLQNSEIAAARQVYRPKAWHELDLGKADERSLLLDHIANSKPVQTLGNIGGVVEDAVSPYKPTTYDNWARSPFGVVLGPGGVLDRAADPKYRNRESTWDAWSKSWGDILTDSQYQSGRTVPGYGDYAGPGQKNKPGFGGVVPTDQMQYARAEQAARNAESAAASPPAAGAAAGSTTPATSLWGALQQAYKDNPYLVGGAGAGLGALGLYGVYSMLRNRRNRQKKQYSRARYPQIIN